MTPYELLRELIVSAQWNEGKRADANACLEKMRELGVLGTLAGQIDETDHECVPNTRMHQRPDGVWVQTGCCIYCNRDLSTEETRVQSPWSGNSTAPFLGGN